MKDNALWPVSYTSFPTYQGEQQQKNERMRRLLELIATPPRRCLCCGAPEGRHHD